jgi:ribosome recycling factor
MVGKELLKDTEAKMKKSVESAKREFSEVRTGRAHPGLIEGMHVDYFGTMTPFKQLASISTPDPRTVMIQPWDPTVIPEIEKAIMSSNLGVNPSNDGKVVRLSIPPLSEERRIELAKVVKEMAEKSRISLRTVRRDSNDKLKKMQSDKEISEDDYFRLHEDVQKLTDKYIKEIDELLDQKSKSLMEIS